MRTAVAGVVLLAVGAGALAAGVLPVHDAVTLWRRVWPVLLFVVAMTVVTELAAAGGVFGSVAGRVVRWGRGRAWLLWLLVVAGSAVSTVFLSLDTTAVLLTPIVVGVARRARLDPVPFAVTTVWMACAGSLLLPVSNLTNLLAQRSMGDPAPLAFARLLWAPALTAMVVPMLLLAAAAHGRLSARYTPHAASPAADPVLLRWTSVVLVVLMPLLVSGLPVWLPAAAAATVLVAVFAVREPGALQPSLLPWRLVLLASGLFLVVTMLQALGAGVPLRAVAGTSGTPAGLLRLAASGMVGANAVDNLPAYLALEPVAGGPTRLAALLVGVNAGALILPWASLAMLLWHDRLTALHVRLPWHRVMLWGAAAAPLTVGTATLALVLTAR